MTLPPGPGALPVPSVCLVILDGWGLAPPGPGNAVELARTPVFDELWATYPHATLTTFGRAVGLPEGQMGNSEVGHLNLGAGQVVRQDLTRIDDAIDDGSFFDNPALKGACAAARQGGRLHLLGLVSPGGVHASMKHLLACIQLAGREQVPEVVLHAFTDGRDSPPTAGAQAIAEAESWVHDAGGRIATLSGRYYAMDRDRRWERTGMAVDGMVRGQAAGGHAPSGEAAVRAAYERGETDEFVKPTITGDEGLMRMGDTAVFFNFRPDRARQLTQALTDAVELHFVTLTQYNETWDYPVAFPPERPSTTLARELESSNLAQLHVAETEKYAHVTYFFNGGEEKPHRGEERQLVDSPRDVPTYDHKPEMSAPAATEAFVQSWRAGPPSFGIINFANPDMVGHTGVIPAAVTAVETVDECLARVVEEVHRSGGVCIVTADHGNADVMLTEEGAPDTAHSLSPAPLVVTSTAAGPVADGTLANVAPTVLALLGLEQPPGMTATSLLKSHPPTT